MSTTATERVYELLRHSILTGEYPPATHLTADSVAKRLGVSRTPVREGLRRLHAEGLVNVIANQGAFVTAWPASEMAEVYGLRAVLEGRAAELAATRLTHSQLDNLRTLATRMEQAVASDDEARLSMVAQLNDRFHKLIAGAAGSRRLVTGIAALVDVPLALNTFTLYSQEQLVRSMHHHRELITAFAERDPLWARAAMECHVLAGRAIYARNAG